MHRARQKYDIDKGKILNFFKDRSGFIPETSVLAHLCETFPEYISEKADKAVSLNAILSLVPDETKFPRRAPSDKSCL